MREHGGSPTVPARRDDGDAREERPAGHPGRGRWGLWGLAEVALLAAAAAMTGGGLAAGASGLVSYVTAGLIAFGAAALAGISVVLNLPERSRRLPVQASPTAQPPPTAQPHPTAQPVSASSTPPRRTGGQHHHHHHLHQRHNDFPRPGHRANGGHEHTAGAQGVPQSSGIRFRSRLRWAFALAVIFLVIEAVAAYISRSLTLLSDVGHVLADAVGLGMALAAIHLANAANRDRSRTYGLYRVEIVAALANAVLLMGMAGYVMVEAALRFSHPEHVPGGTMIVVAVAGLIANLVSVWLLRPGAGESLNVRGAYLDVLADAIGSAGLLIAGVAIRLTDWAWIDPLIGAALGLWIMPRAVVLAREALRVLVQAAPAHLDVAALEADLEAVEGVVDVHHLHIWTLTSNMEVASAHLRVGAGVDGNRVLDDARYVLNDRYQLINVTLQVESADGDGPCAGF